MEQKDDMKPEASKEAKVEGMETAAAAVAESVKGEVKKQAPTKCVGSRCVLQSKHGIWIAAAVVLVLIGVSFWYKEKRDVLTPDAAKAKIVKYITDNLVQPGTEVSVKEIVREGGLYRIALDVQKQEITAYMTTDGKKFFPQAMEIDGGEVEAKKEAEAPKDIPKSDKPQVELFVMSYCPYGTQMEKGILPVVATLGDSIDYSLKFVDYAMHGKKEVDENLRQYCIGKDQSTKLNGYLECFLKKGEGTEQSCMKSVGVDAAKVSACVAAADKEFKVTEQFNDKSTWSGGQFPPFDIDKAANETYGVQGSPTLIINGVQASTQRDSASILKTICGAFNTPVAGCEKELPSVAPAPGFGDGTAAAGSASDAECGN